MNISDDLDALASQDPADAFNTAMVLTFTANLRFFEELVLPRLERVGVSRIGILADRWGYDATFEDPVAAQECGKKYAFNFNGRLRSLQHAKILWLHGERDLVWIGSHNLTTAGYNDQREVSVRLDSNDPGHRAALLACHGFVSRLTESVADVHDVWQRIAMPVVDSVARPTVYFLHSLDRAIGDQLADHLTPAGSLRVVTPFLDADALRRFAAAVGAQSVTLDIPYDGLDVPLSDVTRKVPGLQARRAGAEERLHAKAYLTSDGARTSLALGSANCTNSGLMRAAAAGGNVECVVVVPDGALDDTVPFESVTSADDVPCTGRRTDEPMPHVSGVHVSVATYAAGKLTVVWHTSLPAESVTLTVDGRQVPCQESVVEVEFDHEPLGGVLISARIGDQELTARRWIHFPERLEEFARARSTHRLRNYLEGDDPRSWAEGIEYAFGRLMDLFHRLEPQAQGRSRSSGAGARSSTDVSDALEVLDYSQDRESVRDAATRLIVGNHRVDLLVALRALFGRLNAPPAPIGADVGEDDMIERSNRQQRAAARSSAAIWPFVRFLAGAIGKLTPLDDQRAQEFLSASFAAIAQSWRRMFKSRANGVELRRFGESGLAAVETLRASDRARSLLRQRDVAGPFILALSAFAEAIADDKLAQLRDAARSAFDADAKAAFGAWRDSPSELASALGSQAELDAWSAAGLELFGIPGPRVQIRSKRWELLTRLHAADVARVPEASELFTQAETLYKNDPIWSRYKTLRARARILNVREPTCPTCFQRLPLAGGRSFLKGDPVACACGTILIWHE